MSAHYICTCDDFTDTPCPQHQRENELQDLLLASQQRVSELEKNIKANNVYWEALLKQEREINAGLHSLGTNLTRERDRLREALKEQRSYLSIISNRVQNRQLEGAMSNIGLAQVALQESLKQDLDAKEHKKLTYDATFKVFGMLSDAAEEYLNNVNRGHGHAALDSLHSNADKIAKELLRGDYVYQPRLSNDTEP